MGKIGLLSAIVKLVGKIDIQINRKENGFPPKSISREKTNKPEVWGKESKSMVCSQFQVLQAF